MKLVTWWSPLLQTSLQEEDVFYQVFPISLATLLVSNWD